MVVRFRETGLAPQFSAALVGFYSDPRVGDERERIRHP
jgi:hypothetical protein